MFNKRRVIKVSKRKDIEDNNEDIDQDGVIDKIGKMMTYRVLKSKKIGLNPNDISKYDNDKLNVDEQDDDDEPKYGLLKRKFISDDSHKENDNELEEFIRQHMQKDDKKPVTKRIDTKKPLYQLPEELNVKDDFVERNNDKLGWLNGIAEIPLSAEDKIKNIEAMEEAKREYIKKLSQSSSSDSSSSTSIMNKAFGPRFIT